MWTMLGGRHVEETAEKSGPPRGQEITENQGRRRPGTAEERAHTHILSLSTYSSYTGLVSLYP